MQNWKDNLIDAYRLCTSPIRIQKRWQLSAEARFPIFILFYHRVSDCFPNPWTISCQEFERQIDWMQSCFQFASLSEVQQVIRNGKNRMPLVSITFDDGYAENSEFAIPLLLERKIPFTYFVTVDNLVHQTPFPHDLEFGRALPVNSVESVRALAKIGVEIGSHSRSHANIGGLQDPNQIYDELIVASRELSELISQPVRYFAFPYGKHQNLSARAFELLLEEGFQGACTTLGGWNDLGRDPFELTRLHGDPSLSRIKNWLTLDPRISQGVYYWDQDNPCGSLPAIQ